MYFIVDQINALDHEDANWDAINNTQKDSLSAFLAQMNVGHYRITSALANHKMA